MRYVEHAPSPALLPWVRCYWELEHRRAPGEPAAVERLLPDGCCELVFHFGAPFRCREADGALRRQADALFVGPWTRAVELEPSARADVLGVRFEPGGASLLVRGPVARWTDEIAPVGALERDDTARLHERLTEAPAAARVSLLEAFLRRRAESRRAPALGAAVAALARGGISVAQVARASGLSARQLQRRFRAEVGLGPKVLERIGRLQRAVRLARAAPRASLAAVAHASGYADQAHFTRDFRALGGGPPGAFLAEEHPLAEAFLDAVGPRA